MRKDLEKLKMSELRRVGEPLGARDTKKSELIEEIIMLSGIQSTTRELITKIQLAEGDAIETYKLRDDIIFKLKKLLKTEVD